MSAAVALRAALLAALRGEPAVAARVNAVAEGEPVQATPPVALVQDLASVDWGTKDRAGREIRVAVIVRDAGDTPARAGEIADAIEQAVAGMPRDLPGWRIASVVMIRARTGAEARGRWSASVEHRFRLLAN